MEWKEAKSKNNNVVCASAFVPIVVADRRRRQQQRRRRQRRMMNDVDAMKTNTTTMISYGVDLIWISFFSFFFSSFLLCIFLFAKFPRFFISFFIWTRRNYVWQRSALWIAADSGWPVDQKESPFIKFSWLLKILFFLRFVCFSLFSFFLLKHTFFVFGCSDFICCCCFHVFAIPKCEHQN